MSTNWKTVTLGDLENFLNARQLAAIRTRALAEGQADPVAAIIADIVASIRLAIASCARNRLSATPATIPPELMEAAAALIIAAAQTRLSIGLALSEDQREAVRRADRRLREIASCDLRVTAPTDPEPEPTAQGGGSVQIVGGRERIANRQGLDGL